MAEGYRLGIRMQHFGVEVEASVLSCFLESLLAHENALALVLYPVPPLGSKSRCFRVWLYGNGMG